MVFILFLASLLLLASLLMLVRLLVFLLLLESLLLLVSILLFTSVMFQYVVSAAVHPTVYQCSSCEFLLLLLPLTFLASLLHVASFSTIADFPSDFGCCWHPCCFVIVPAAAAIPDDNGIHNAVVGPCMLLRTSLLWQAFLMLLAYCVACVPAAASGHPCCY